MTISAGFIHALLLFFALIGGASDIDEVFRCEVTELSEYGFESVSENDEYVCKHQSDSAYFTVIEDENEVLSVGDVLLVGMDIDGDVEKAVILDEEVTK